MPPASIYDKKTTEVALAALAQVFESIAEIILISGISVADACQLMRACAVRVAAREHCSRAGKSSKSRVAIATGLSRSEVSRLWLKKKSTPQEEPSRQSRSQRVIDAWFDSPKYLNKAGEPDSIPIFGHRKSFEHLVKLHGGGSPVRAMLDELLSIDVVEVDDKQRVQVKSRLAIQKGVRATSLNSFGIRASDLLGTLAHNLTNESPHFEGSAFVCNIDPKSLPLIRREVANRGLTFISSVDEFLNASTKGTKLPDKKLTQSRRRAGVGVFYFEDRPSNGSSNLAKNASRKYLKRKHRLNRKEK